MTQITMLPVRCGTKTQGQEESKVRPWVIPIGLDFRVISQPSNQTQYLDIGVMFGAGYEYQV